MCGRFLRSTKTQFFGVEDYTYICADIRIVGLMKNWYGFGIASVLV